MNDSPFTAIGDEPVEARIVAWVLGEASAFEAAELERLCEERPELLVFRRRMRALHGLLTEAEAEQPDEGWKLSAEKRKVLDEIFGEVIVLSPDPIIEKRVASSARRALLAIAACLILTVIVAGLFASGGAGIQKSRKISYNRESLDAPDLRGMIVDQREQNGMVPPPTAPSSELAEGTPDSTDMVTRYAAKETPPAMPESASTSADLAYAGKNIPSSMAPNPGIESRSGGNVKLDGVRSNVGASTTDDMVYVGGQARSPGAVRFKEGLTLGDAVSSAGGMTDFGSAKRVRLMRDGKEQTVDLSDDRSRQLVLEPNDSVEIRQKALFDGGEAGRVAQNEMDERAEAKSTPAMPETALAQNAPASAGEKAQSPTDAIPIIETRSTGLELDVVSGFSTVSGWMAASGPQQPMAKGKAFDGGAGEVAEFTKEEKGGKAADAAEFGDALAFHSTKDGTKPLAGKADDLRRSLHSAEGNYNLGKYDEAKTEYESALKKDPYNAAARRGLERVAAAKTDYFRAAYDHTRAELLSQVDKSWELAVPAEGENKGSAGQEGVITGTSVMPSLTTGNLAVAPSDGGIDLAKQFDQLRDTPGSSMDITKNLGDVTVFAGMAQSSLGNSQVERGRSLLSPEMQSYNLKAAELSDQLYSSSDSDESQKNLSLDTSNPPTDFEGFANFGKPIYGLESNLPAPRGMIVDPELRFMTKMQAPEKPSGPPAPAATPVSPTTATAWMGLDEGMKANRSATDQKEASKRQLAVPSPSLTDLMQEIAASEEPYSTFSLNISDASFQVAQAALAKGERPDPAGIKVEQFYNAVDYGDPAPSAGEPVALAIEQSAHPVIPGRSLVRVALKTAAAGRAASQPLRLTLLVDQSGSMVREDRRAAMEKALAGLGGLLTDKDLVTVIGFSRTPRLLADGLQGDKAGKLADLVNQTASEGGTNLEQAIQLAGQLADRHKLAAAQNRIVLFTDGAANLGNADPVRLAEKVKVLRQQGIAFDIAGIAADGLNDELLGELARNGNGRYYVVGKGGDDNFAKQLAGAFRPAAENVKVQVQFNPERVGRYKLIGFEKDRLKTEDFRNDAVDAAELAAEEAGVAIYQVETLPDGKGELGEVSVRFRDAASAGMVERTWTMSHDGNSVAFDRASPSMQLATLSMLAAEKLKGGPLADAIDFNQLADPRANVKRFYGNSGRIGEVLNMVDALK